MSPIYIPRLCDDDAVQEFLAHEFRDFSDRAENLTARGLLTMARWRFGARRCDSVSFWQH
jgi:hypothetical protein